MEYVVVVNNVMASIARGNFAQLEVSADGSVPGVWSNPRLVYRNGINPNLLEFDFYGERPISDGNVGVHPMTFISSTTKIDLNKDQGKH